MTGPGRQKAAVTENSTFPAAIDEPSFVLEKFGLRTRAHRYERRRHPGFPDIAGAGRA